MVNAKVLVLGCVIAAVPPVHAREPLTMRLAPAMAAAPAYLTVRANIESDEDNRFVEVVVQSADFYTSSAMELDGDRAPKMALFNFRDLPRGNYEVTATLVGRHGKRGAAAGWFRSISGPGQ